MKVLILGATGLVGQSALVRAVTHPAITHVIVPTREPLPPSSKLSNSVAERLKILLPEVLTWVVDAVICALGTTSGKAGSKEAFRQVDYVLPLAFAKLAHQQGAEAFALVSAIGADANSSFFYPKTKGEVKRDMKLVGFKSLTILRPSIIGGKRDESRFYRRTCSDTCPEYRRQFFRKSFTSIPQRRSPAFFSRATLLRSRVVTIATPKV
jgi:uncharacterized protein YbjT (DUF2867 family)